MEPDDKTILEFLSAQLRDHAVKSELEPGLWTLFAFEASDAAGGTIASSLLAAAPFAHQSGVSEDDRWIIHYVDTAHRPAALDWVESLSKVVAGEVRPVLRAQRALIHEVAGSDAPHRIAQRLVEAHARGELSAGSFREPPVVRALLDRLHAREPLFFSAFHSLLANHLVDMIVLLQQLIPEDLELKNEIVKGGISRDPYLQTRQDAAAEIRNVLIRFHLINALDQRKNTALANPYEAFMEIVRQGDEIAAPIDGQVVPLARPSFIKAIRAIRRNLYRGGELARFDTQSPWMHEEIAYSFRFIKQRLASRRDLSPMDALFMLERAVES